MVQDVIVQTIVTKWLIVKYVFTTNVLHTTLLRTLYFIIPYPGDPRNDTCLFTLQEISQGDFAPHSGRLEKEIKKNGEGK